jgi:predicted MFS family arabinose efflux permease
MRIALTEGASTDRAGSRRGSRLAFWASAAVIALCLWSSGAPSLLYPLYAAEWGLTPAHTTAVFSAYPATLLVVLLLFGGISDTIGRRRAMLLGVVLICASAVAFALAQDIAWLFVGRSLQGIGTGLALGAASAGLAEHNVRSNPRFASSMASIATSAGLALALVVGGALSQLLPIPLVLAYVVLLSVGVACLIAVWASPDDRPAVRPGWRPQRLSVARGTRLGFVAATLSVSIAYSIGAIYLALGAQMMRAFSGITNMLVIGGLLGGSTLTIGITALFLSRISAHTTIRMGAILSLATLAVMVGAASTGSMIFFYLWCAIGGAAYAFSFTGGLGLITRSAPPEHRGATLSALYLCAYLLQALTAVGAGALATVFDLGAAIDIVAPILAALCVACLVIAVVDIRRVRAVAAIG